VRRHWVSLCAVWPSHSKWPNEQISFITTMHLPILQLSCRLFWQSITSPRSVSTPYSPDLSPCNLWLFPKLKSPLKGRRFVNAMVTLHKLSQWRLTANWLAPQESDCSRTNSKISSDWLSSYIKATRPVLKIFKLNGYFLGKPSYLNTAWVKAEPHYNIIMKG